jgi:hypothetical protein
VDADLRRVQKSPEGRLYFYYERLNLCILVRAGAGQLHLRALDPPGLVPSGPADAYISSGRKSRSCKFHVACAGLSEMLGLISAGGNSQKSGDLQIVIDTVYSVLQGHIASQCRAAGRWLTLTWGEGLSSGCPGRLRLLSTWVWVLPWGLRLRAWLQTSLSHSTVTFGVFPFTDLMCGRGRTLSRR